MGPSLCDIRGTGSVGIHQGVIQWSQTVDHTLGTIMSMSRDGTVSSPEGGKLGSFAALRSWSLWTQRPRVIAYCLVSFVLAVGPAAVLLVIAPVRMIDLILLAVLAGMGIFQAELGRQAERMRRRISGVAHINMTSVWIFAGVLLLPAALAAALTMVLYAHLAARSWFRLHRTPTWRTTNNASVLVLTCYASSSVLAFSGIDGIREAVSRGWVGVAVVCATLTMHFVANALLVIPARDRIVPTPSGLFGSWADNVLELATLCLGALNALALATLPGLAVLVLPPLLLVHRAVLVKQLEVAATTDGKTGVLNSAGWHSVAERELARSQQRQHAFGLLMIDLDFFKQVNDTHGHLAGDAVLHEVAAAIRSEVRDRDAVGRFGGEEFVVLLPEVDLPAAAAVAERIRGAIARLEVEVPNAMEAVTIRSLSASIGVSMYPTAGDGLQRLLDAADTALYQAKTAGRNQVILSYDNTTIPTKTTPA